MTQRRWRRRAPRRPGGTPAPQRGSSACVLVDTAGPGAFVGQDGLATNRPRNAHVIARDDVTCFVLAPRGRDLSAGRGTSAIAPEAEAHRPGLAPVSSGNNFTVDVHAALHEKMAALVAYRSQYALDAELLPRQVLGPLLSTEHLTVVN